MSSLCRPHHVVTCPQSRTLPPAGAFQVPGLSSLTSACSFMLFFSHCVGKPRRFLGLGAGSARHSRARAGHRAGVRSRPPGPAAGLPSCLSVPPLLPRRPVSLVVQWVDVTRLEKNATLLFPESIRVDTRDQELFFSMFLNIGETFKLMEQLANLAVRQLLDSEGFLEEKAPPRPPRPHRNISALKRCVGPPAGTAPAPCVGGGPLKGGCGSAQRNSPRGRRPPREPGRPQRVRLRERSRLPARPTARLRPGRAPCQPADRGAVAGPALPSSSVLAAPWQRQGCS